MTEEKQIEELLIHASQLGIRKSVLSTARTFIEQKVFRSRIEAFEAAYKVHCEQVPQLGEQL